jgi:hypothetical protein
MSGPEIRNYDRCKRYECEVSSAIWCDTTLFDWTFREAFCRPSSEKPAPVATAEEQPDVEPLPSFEALECWE